MAFYNIKCMGLKFHKFHFVESFVIYFVKKSVLKQTFLVISFVMWNAHCKFI